MLATAPLPHVLATLRTRIENGDLRGHFRFSRAEAMIESISTGGGPDRFFSMFLPDRRLPSKFQEPRPSARRRDIGARGLPFSTSTIHCRLTPTWVARVFWSRQEFYPPVAYDGSWVDWCSNPHAASQNVSDRRHYRMSAIADMRVWRIVS